MPTQTLSAEDVRQRDRIADACSFRDRRVAELEAAATEAEDQAGRLRRGIEEWRRMIPAELLDRMDTEARLQADAGKSAASAARLAEGHRRAMAAVKSGQKALICPGNKWPLNLPIYAAVAFGAVSLLLTEAFSLHGDLWRVLAWIAGCLVGFIVGATIYGRVFVEDESLR